MLCGSESYGIIVQLKTIYLRREPLSFTYFVALYTVVQKSYKYLVKCEVKWVTNIYYFLNLLK
jgi:hypothetical protein